MGREGPKESDLLAFHCRVSQLYENLHHVIYISSSRSVDDYGEILTAASGLRCLRIAMGTFPPVLLHNYR